MKVYLTGDSDYLLDQRLSYRARGLLGELLSYPDGADVTLAKLAEAGREAPGKVEGRDALSKALGELTRAGYVRHVRVHGERGQAWYEPEVSDVPFTDDHSS